MCVCEGSWAAHARPLLCSVSVIRTAGFRIAGVGPVRPRRADSQAGFLLAFGRHRLHGSISPSAVSALASAIQTQEGYYPGSVAYRNNNPGNLVYAGQAGASPGVGGFASFPSYSLGYQALQNQIVLDATRGTDVTGNPTTTVSQLLTSWAPPGQNDTAAYIASVTSQTGYDPNAPLSTLGDPEISAGTSSPVIVPASDDDSGFSFGDYDPSVDLSSVGLPSSVPAFGLVAAALGIGLLIANL